jgi:hypothetical protein
VFLFSHKGDLLEILKRTNILRSQACLSKLFPIIDRMGIVVLELFDEFLPLEDSYLFLRHRLNLFVPKLALLPVFVHFLSIPPEF